MANFYTDNPDLRHHLNHPLMEKIVELKERNYSDAAKYDYAPMDFADAMDSYDKVLEIVGDICGGTIADNAEGVDHDGPKVENGRVIYAPGTQENLDLCRKAGCPQQPLIAQRRLLLLCHKYNVQAAAFFLHASGSAEHSGQFCKPAVCCPAFRRQQLPFHLTGK